MAAISIIIVSYNSQENIIACLGSIFAQGFKDYEAIVVDNLSKDSAKTIIKNTYPTVLLIENPENFGACYARNQGIAKASGRFILCLDQDVTLLPGFLENAHKTIESNACIGAVGPKILMSDSDTIYSSGIHFSYFRRAYDIGSGRLDSKISGENKYVFGVSAAAALYRREALESIRQGREYFDEDFFYFFEDVDLSWRLQNKGWRQLYCPQAVCLHRAGRSRNKDSVSQYYCFRNRYLMIIKNESFFGFLRFVIVFFLYDLWRNLFMLLFNPKYFLKACYEIARLFPRMLKKRHYATC